MALRAHFIRAALVLACALVTRSAHAQVRDDRWAPEGIGPEEPIGPPPIRIVIGPSTTPEPRRELEPRGAPFGARGQWIVWGDSQLAASGAIYESGATFYDAGAQLSLGYFVAEHVALGVSAAGSYGVSRGFNGYGNLVREENGSVGGGPTLGYDVRLGRRVSLFPRVGFLIGYDTASFALLQSNGRPATSADTSHSGEVDTEVTAYLPLVIHPVQHFFFGFGPTFAHHFGTTKNEPDVGTQTTTLGLNFLVGGNIGGDVPAEDTHDAPPRRYRKRLGDAGTVLLTNSLVLSGFWSSLPRTASNAGSIDASFAFDYFVDARFSGGAGLEIAYAHGEGVDGAQAQRYTSDSDLLAAQVRARYDLRLGSLFALIPRARASIGLRDSKIVTGSGTNQHSSGYANVGLFVPFAIEPADHFMVGAGPFIAQDLTNVDGAERENRETTFGLESEIGGWW